MHAQVRPFTGVSLDRKRRAGDGISNRKYRCRPRREVPWALLDPRDAMHEPVYLIPGSNKFRSSVAPSKRFLGYLVGFTDHHRADGDEYIPDAPPGTQVCQQRTQRAQCSLAVLFQFVSSTDRKKTEENLILLFLLGRTALLSGIVDDLKEFAAVRCRPAPGHGCFESDKAKSARELEFLAKRAGNAAVSGFKGRHRSDSAPVNSEARRDLMDFQL